ncbi:site-specific integrase [Rhizobium sp. WYCCWR 11152]|uniref:site-specific integrase n=1 Tax=Rhizobium sp. WYCCWR 11152 TaxID=2692316 RepID=UPI0014927006|nr:site-specific integrase [Rhizobium sp. WYCCWR 11152]NNU70395.1 site-specific integrase [Rhizobium sp. WYCCWR 11152]
MGTIAERRRKDGSKSYTAQIRIKRDGKLAHTEAQTFDRKPAASAWLKKRETELSQPGALDRIKVDDKTLSDAIDQYLLESRKDIGRTKAQCLELIKKHPLASKPSSSIVSADIASFASDLRNGWVPEDEEEAKERKPQTVANYMSHMGAVFAIAKPMWGIPLNEQEFKDAAKVTKRLGIISKSEERSRRPTIKELDLILAYFADRSISTPQSMPMVKVILFALFSTRRQDEITRIKWEFYDPHHKRVLVEDMKHPGSKKGNNRWCDLTPEAQAIIESMPRKKPEIFPYSADAISANFTRACKLLGIADLHFHDLRHEGISRLFEMGWDIPHVATVSAHRSWNSLKRYTHIRQVGDKYAGWKWMKEFTDGGAAGTP